MENCYHCSKPIQEPHQCHYCSQIYCTTHYLAEKHQCPKVMASATQPNYEKKGIQGTKFAISCKKCGYVSDFATLDNISRSRYSHIQNNHCPSHLVQLIQKDDKNVNSAFIRNYYPTNTAHNWMYGCFEEAKRTISFHGQSDETKIFRKISVKITVQNLKHWHSTLEGKFPNYKIIVDKEFEKNSEDVYLATLMIFMHNLLYILYGSLSKTKVSEKITKITTSQKKYNEALQILNSKPSDKKICSFDLQSPNQ